MRLSVATVVIAALVGLCWLDFHSGRPGLWLLPVAALLAVLAGAEVLSLLEASGGQPLHWVVHTGTVMVMLATGVPILWSDYPADHPLGQLGWPLSALALSTILAFTAEMWRFQKPGAATANVAASIFVVSYVGLLMSFLAALRLLGDNRWGMAALVSVIFVAKIADTGAFAVGRLLGRHKMAPLISPGKTIEGALGGMVAACLGSYVVFTVVDRWLEPHATGSLQWGWIVYGLVVGLAGMLGDLAESLLKRDAGRKESSQWLPGLGGVLDILDSILFAAPVAYVCWIIGLVGP